MKISDFDDTYQENRPVPQITFEYFFEEIDFSEILNEESALRVPGGNQVDGLPPVRYLSLGKARMVNREAEIFLLEE